MTKTAYFIRHGETEFNRDMRLQGWLDSPLSDRGRAQVRSLAQPLRALGIRFAWVSPLGRAQETGEILRQELRIRLETLDELREVSFGDFEGKTLPELDRIYPGQWEARQADKWSYCPPGGEANKDAVPRGRNVVRRIEEYPEKEAALIVAHFAINRIILALLAGLSPRETVEMNIPHDVIYRAQKMDGTWSISHLSAKESEKGFIPNWLLQKQPENLPIGE